MHRSESNNAIDDSNPPRLNSRTWELAALSPTAAFLLLPAGVVGGATRTRGAHREPNIGANPVAEEKAGDAKTGAAGLQFLLVCVAMQ